MATTTPSPSPSTQASCNILLLETIGLIRQSSPLTSASQQRLEFLLSSCFQDDDPGRDFRSLLCTGRLDTRVTLDELNQFVIWPLTQYQYQLQVSVHIPALFRRIDPVTCKQLNHDKLLHAHSKVEFVLAQVVSHHPLKATIESFMKKSMPDSWKNALLGINRRAVSLKADPPSFEELQRRIEQSFTFALSLKEQDRNSQFFTTASGGAWQPVAPVAPVDINYEEIYLAACSEFPAYLDKLLKDSEQTLDEHAGVKVPHEYPAVEARFQKLLDLCPPGRVEGIDLRKGKDKSAALGGTICAIHEYVSARFLAYYVVDHDASCPYMADIRSLNKKDRKIRVASVKHVNTKPVWVQFGEKSEVYLYLSKKASVAEEAWLAIVNHVMKLLVDLVNSKLKKRLGKNVAKEKLVRMRIYTELISLACHPADGNYGLHGDDRNGTSSKDDPQFSRFMLMVPTFCLQNYTQATTEIAWKPRYGDTGWTAGFVFQLFCLIHIQLLGVQEYFLHSVSRFDQDHSRWLLSLYLNTHVYLFFSFYLCS